MGMQMKNFKKMMTLMALCLSVAITTSGYATTLPDIPEPLKNGTGAIDNNGVIYVGLGTAGTSWYKIDLKKQHKDWERIKLFPGGAREQSVSVFLNDELYVFGGVGKKNSESPLQVYSDVYKYSPVKNTWQKVDTISPVGLTGHTGVKLNETMVLITGGVNEHIFDKYFIDIAAAAADESEKNKVIYNYFNKPAKDYFFNKIVFIYNAKENTWKNAGELPDAGTAGSSSVMENNFLMLINGELKPGLRTDVIYRAMWDNDKLTWLKNSQLPPSPGEQQQEGLAGAFSGYSHGVLLVGGGANFPGAKQNYTNGKFYSHEGINKKWRDEVYGLVNGHWQYMGKMKQPLGYGVSVSYGDEVFLIGGENAKGKPVSSVTSFTMRDGNLLIK
ncbi:N-acetylneuraminic acid mutarotase [Salmonella enterica subsp. enterica serovar Legon]|uniref:N-acetylneuraminate epimerase n=1 Tax=Salmonella enterica TaxID=28901 RepID=UPI000D3EA516|nr:N-acetylneuraminate epimerase [Salmonella enterica]PVB68549.1 N-acetylneuraminic acid mutarotase [Salmonella enterica subsp. enterica serovar Legon]PVB82547.1 N-acetylneuraminic acid mutarotase [Salmonella enterica subsp. enterica serovar Legon]PVB95607.1 N-acetylneuraminic acid mutarotase [Salmonella enterica subsp. enterica serovar Legon]PVC03486.1 N-acetylneuraminic acid mutarotase [Salmonella enterica subsp. enterica serovar Legon]PVC09957.1 N-acetylneuraminic acid mutarotase [Salmonell